MCHRYHLVIAGLLMLATLRVDLPARETACEGRACKAEYVASMHMFDQAAPRAHVIYGTKRDQLLDRMHRHFFVRRAQDGRAYGEDELDPLLWRTTKYLLEDESHRQAVALLDEFLDTRAERTINDPLKRAFLQRDLWAVFDWLSSGDDTHSDRRSELQARLAEIIKRLSLTRERLIALPDNYAEAVAAKVFSAHQQPGRDDLAFLPPEIFQVDGSWVCISNNQGEPVAATHAQFFGGRSTFLVFVRLPAGRDATLAYLQQLREFPQPWVVNSDRFQTPEPLLPNPRLPQFPVGSQFALVRQLNLIDDQGRLTPTRLTESIQIRHYHAIPEGVVANVKQARESQGFYKFTLSRVKLFAREAGGLSLVTRDKKEFPLFMSQGIDWFEIPTGGNGSADRFQVAVINTCANCHSSPGVHSMLSYSRRRFAREYLSPPAIKDSNTQDESSNTVYWKAKQYDWGLLQGLWHSARRTNPVTRL